MDFARSLTRNLPGPVQKPLLKLLGQECYTILVYDLDIFHGPCFKLATSKLVSAGILGGSALMKIPQITKIISSRSARGISLLSYLLDTSSLLVNVAYNMRNKFAISTYGENIALVAQNAIIIVLILLYGTTAARSRPQLSTSTLLSVITMAAISNGVFYALLKPDLVSMPLLRQALTASIPMSMLSKVPQIFSNLRNGSTGQLSASVVFLALIGCLARMFTTAAETGDSLLFASFAATAALNGILALQMLYYWNSTTKAEKQADQKAKVQTQLVDSAKQTKPVADHINQERTASNRTPSPRKEWVRKAA